MNNETRQALDGAQAASEAMLERDMADLELLRKIRGHNDLPFLVEALQKKKDRSLRYKRPKHAAYIGDVIELLGGEP